MRRRGFLAGLVTAGCAPWSASTDDEPRPAAPVIETPPMELLTVASWSGMMDSTSLALYANGLIDRRFLEEDRRRAYRMAVASPEQVRQIRGDLASSGFAEAEPYYHQEGVMDGGSFTVASVATSRRIVVVNHPRQLPVELYRLSEQLWKLAQYAEARGQDPFDEATPHPARLLLVHEVSQPRLEGTHVLSVFDHGDAELRITHVARKEGQAESDYPTPRSRMRRLEESRVAELRHAVEELRRASIPLEHVAPGYSPYDLQSHWLTIAGGTYRVATEQPVPEPLRTVLELGEELASEI